MLSLSKHNREAISSLCHSEPALRQTSSAKNLDFLILFFLLLPPIFGSLVFLEKEHYSFVLTQKNQKVKAA
jgi:hypothetical protein